MITTCTSCGALYEAGSGEQANEPVRWCGGNACLQDIGAAANGTERDGTEAALRELYKRAGELQGAPRFHLRDRIWFVVLAQHSGISERDGTLQSAIADLFVRMSAGEDLRG